MDTIAVQIRVAGIRETRFFIQESSLLTIENIRPETAYHIKAETVIEHETDVIVIIFDIRLVLKNKPEITLIHYVAQMRYELGGFEMSVHDDPTKVRIPTELMKTLITAAYSTFRGTLYSRCAGSILREAILPLHDPSAFLQNQQVTGGPLIPKPPLQED